MRQKSIVVKRIVLIVILLLLILPGFLILYLKNYTDPWNKKISRSGYVEKKAAINGVLFSYVEGADNGPPLILLHAQHMDWFSYSRVLPELSQYFHVYAIDYPGHGTTSYPGHYLMKANQIGKDLGDFIEEVVAEPVFITGNSSGGLLTTWLAAYRQELVKAILLEDPPLFSAEYPRIKQTIAYRSFTTSYNFVKDNQTDFLLYWINDNSVFFDNHIFKGAADILALIVKVSRSLNPDIPVEIGLISNDTVRLFIRGLAEFDARFGAAFYDGSWNEDFDHAKSLAQISCPVLLLHAHHEILADGTLNGAMTEAEANRAMSLLADGRYRNIDSSHVVHLDKPDQYLDIIKNFFLDIR